MGISVYSLPVVLCRLIVLWLYKYGLRTHQPVAEFRFVFPNVLTNQSEIEIKPLCVFHAELAHFFNYRIFHISSPKSSSGDTISGQT